MEAGLTWTRLSTLHSNHTSPRSNALDHPHVESKYTTLAKPTKRDRGGTRYHCLGQEKGVPPRLCQAFYGLRARRYRDEPTSAMALFPKPSGRHCHSSPQPLVGIATMELLPTQYRHQRTSLLQESPVARPVIASLSV
jgi:hypothetical protein